ncbi:MAG: hypothetical protein COA69_04115 [Robiginitomaculum sp.]|nr:MAG: hypothetical protein COA69_04115 [Robiginitomaculum sp.]
MPDIIEKIIQGNITITQGLSIILIVWLTQFVTWGAKKLWVWFFDRRRPGIHDKRVMDRYENLFHPEVVDFLKVHTFSSPYKRDILDKIQEAMYYDRLSTPDFIFHNKKLENDRAELIAKLSVFNRFLVIETFVIDGNMELCNVPIKMDDPTEEKRGEIIAKLNQYASDLSASFEKLKTTQNKLFDEKHHTQ